MGVLPLVGTVSMELFPVAGFGLKLPVSPEGALLMLSVTPPVKPPTRVMFTVYVALAPWATLWLAGVTLNEKSGGGFTTSVAEAVCVSEPLVPVTVTR